MCLFIVHMRLSKYTKPLKIGAGDEIRTRDILLGRRVLSNDYYEEKQSFDRAMLCYMAEALTRVICLKNNK